MNWHPLIMCGEMALAYRAGRKRQVDKPISMKEPT